MSTEDKPVSVSVEIKSEDVVKALQVTEPILTRATDFLGKVIGQPVVIASSMVSDFLSAFQWRCRVYVGERAREVCEEKGIEPKSLPPQFLMPLMAAAGMAAEPEIQELWAQLLASAMDSKDAQHPAFIDVIRRLSAIEAKTFAAIVDERYNKISMARYVLRTIGAMAPATPRPISPQPTDSKEIAVLKAVGLLDSMPHIETGMDGHSAIRTSAEVTRFGLEFARAAGLLQKPNYRERQIEAAKEKTDQTSGG